MVRSGEDEYCLFNCAQIEPSGLLTTEWLLVLTLSAGPAFWRSSTAGEIET